MPRFLKELRVAPPNLIGKGLGLFCILLIAAIWYAVTMGDIPEERTISPAVLPSPYEMISSWDSLVERGLWAGMAATLERVFIGFGLAVLFGVGFGIAAATWRPLQAFLSPLVLFGRSLPLAALIPLTVLWFGIEDKQKIMFIFIATVPFIFSDTVAAILAIHERYVETALTLGATKRQIIQKVLVPLALPEIVTSIRILFGLAFGYIMLAEVINAKAGIGYLINQSQTRGARMDHMILLLLIIGLMAYVIDRVILWFQRGVFPYRTDL